MVLVVEDDSIIAEGLKLALTGEGMEVTLASSVAEAYRALENLHQQIRILHDILPVARGCRTHRVHCCGSFAYDLYLLKT